MGWFRKPDRPEIARRKGSRTTRVCRFEQMEARLMLSADPIYIGAVFTETSSTSLESEGDRFEISWVGGANGTQLTQLQISGDINQNGILDNGDVFFDIDGSNPGVGPFFPFTIANDSDIKAQDITWSLSPDKTTLILTISGWDAGEKLIFEIDADELDNAPNSLVDGAEFQGSILTATWIDTNGHHEVITGSGIFFDNYDHLIASGVNVPRDSDLPPSEGTHERTAGTGFSVQQEVRPFTISGRVYHDVNLNGQYNGGAETGIANVELSLWLWNENTSTWQDTGHRATTDANGDFSFTHNVPGQYRIFETQPSGYFSTGATAGTGGNFESFDAIANITLLGGEHSTGHLFGEALPGALSGHVYHDANNDGIRGVGETGIGGVTIQVDPLDPSAGGPLYTITNPDGSWSIGGLDPTLSYRITEIHPASPWIDGKDAVGSLGGVLESSDTITQVAFTASGQQGVNYNFGELLPGSISGRVFADPNNNVVFDSGDTPLAGVVLELLDANGNPTGTTTTTDANGFYTFTGLTPGVAYGIREIQPAGYFDGNEVAGTAGGSVTANDTIRGVVLASDQHATGYDFGELPPASLTGYVYGDMNNNGVKDGSESGLANVQMELLDAQGNGLGIFAITDANGRYTFTHLQPGVYGVRQVTQPTGWFDGLESVGNAGGTANNPGDSITSIQLPPGTDAVQYNFGELPPASFAGVVYVDANNNGILDGGEQRLAGVVMELLDASGNPTGTTTVTDSQGRYSFGGLAHGIYGVRQVAQPAGYFDGLESVGSAGGVADNPGDRITQISLAVGQDAVNYNFGELPPGSISGYVFRDENGDCYFDPGELGIAGVMIELLDANGNVLQTTYTLADGSYRFDNLAPGVYGVRETQPVGYFDGGDRAGSAGGFAHNPGDLITDINLAAGQHAVDYTFCEKGPSSISGYVFQDGAAVQYPAGQVPSLPQLQAQRNGQFTPDDTPLAGVRLFLADGNGNFLRDSNGNVISTVTNAAGYYSFTGLAPGVYTVFQEQPQGYYDGIDTPGTTGGVAANFGNEGHPGLAGINHGYNAIAQITLLGTQNSQFNNFSEIAAVPEVPPPPPPPIPPILPPEVQFPPPPTPQQPAFLQQGPLLLGQQVAPVPYQNIDLYFGSSGQATPTAYSWHLSVINAGNPRGNSRENGSLVSVAEARLDVFTSAHKQDMKNGYFVIPKEGPGEDDVFNFGLEGAIPIAGDFNGDGKAEVGVFYAGNWYIDLNGNGVWDDGDLWAKLGEAGDRPVVGDWDGDGKADIGIFGPEWPEDHRVVMSEPGLPDRQNYTSGARKNMPPRAYETSLGQRTIKRTATGELRTDVIDHVFYYGGKNDHPVVGDWNGDGVDTIGVFMNGTWILDDNGDGRWLPGETMVEFGQAGDIPVVGDFNGDGVDQLGVFRDGKWIIDSNGNHTIDAEDLVIEFGQAGDIPIVGDWSGDGIDEVGVYRQGVIQKPEL